MQLTKTERTLMPEYDVILKYEIHSYLPTGQDPEEYLFNIPFQVIGLIAMRCTELASKTGVEIKSPALSAMLNFY